MAKVRATGRGEYGRIKTPENGERDGSLLHYLQATRDKTRPNCEISLSPNSDFYTDFSGPKTSAEVTGWPCVLGPSDGH